MALSSDSKLAQVREAMAADDWDQAIRLAAKFKDLGAYKKPIIRAKESLNNPDIYRQLGCDLQLLRKLGIEALKKKFSISWKGVQENSSSESVGPSPRPGAP